MPFDKLIFCNIGNPQSLEQKPITFNREVLALLEHPVLLEHPKVCCLCCMPSDPSRGQSTPDTKHVCGVVWPGLIRAWHHARSRSSHHTGRRDVLSGLYPSSQGACRLYSRRDWCLLGITRLCSFVTTLRGLDRRGGRTAMAHTWRMWAGVATIRESVAKFITERDGYESNMDNIFLTDGASPAVQMFIRALIRNEKDALMIPIPQVTCDGAPLC